MLSEIIDLSSDKSILGKNNPFYNKHHSLTSLKQMLETRIKNGTHQKGHTHWNFGNHYSKKRRLLISISR